MSEALIRVEDVTFEYPGLRAVDHVSFEIPRGSITALVGPNGAGKTTLMRAIAALERPMWGRVTMDGHDVYAEPRWTHARMGYLPDFFGVYEELSVARCLAHRAAAQSIPRKLRAEKIEKAARRMRLERRMDQKAGELSRGLRQRLAIAQAIIHEPLFVLLDEPASGLDPEARYALSTVLRGLCADGISLLVSSHILSELEDYSTHLAIMRNGRLIEFGPLSGSRHTEDRSMLDVLLAGPAPDGAAPLESFPEVEVMRRESWGMSLLAPPDPAFHARLLRALVEAGWPVSGFAPHKARLQDSYISRIRHEDAAEDEA
jgi:ABC-2 type transport system ATP-binding protein